MSGHDPIWKDASTERSFFIYLCWHCANVAIFSIVSPEGRGSYLFYRVGTGESTRRRRSRWPSIDPNEVGRDPFPVAIQTGRVAPLVPSDNIIYIYTCKIRFKSAMDLYHKVCQILFQDLNIKCQNILFRFH